MFKFREFFSRKLERIRKLSGREERKAESEGREKQNNHLNKLSTCMSISNRIEQDPRNEWAARANKHCARGWRNKQTDVVNKQVATKSSKITGGLLFLQLSYFFCLWWPRDEDLECGNSCLCLPPLYARNSRWDGRFSEMLIAFCLFQFVSQLAKWVFPARFTFTRQCLLQTDAVTKLQDRFCEKINGTTKH